MQMHLLMRRGMLSVMSENLNPSVAPAPSASETTTACWTRLVRLQRKLLAAVESDLKSAGFPPLAVYDALLELCRAPQGRLRPLDLERAMLLPQYSTSRLVDRMEKAGLVLRQACAIDGRGQFIGVTDAGRSLKDRMWTAYGASLERHVGSRLREEEAAQLRDLLGKLA